jgi:hypothetical protein
MDSEQVRRVEGEREGNSEATPSNPDEEKCPFCPAWFDRRGLTAHKRWCTENPVNKQRQRDEENALINGKRARYKGMSFTDECRCLCPLGYTSTCTVQRLCLSTNRHLTGAQQACQKGEDSAQKRPIW